MTEPSTRANLNDFQVWQLQGDKLFRWVGGFYELQSARDWIREQPSGNYAINNIPPSTSNSWAKSSLNSPEVQAKLAQMTPKNVKATLARVAETAKVVTHRPAPRKVVQTKEMAQAKQAARQRLNKHLKDEAEENK